MHIRKLWQMFLVMLALSKYFSQIFYVPEFNDATYV